MLNNSVNKSFVSELQQVRPIVLEELGKDTRARNDDKFLTWAVMRHFTNIYIPFEDFCKIPSFESIRRMRQKIQNEEHQYLPTNETILKRRLREKEVRSVINSSVVLVSNGSSACTESKSSHSVKEHNDSSNQDNSSFFDSKGVVLPYNAGGSSLTTKTPSTNNQEVLGV